MVRPKSTPGMVRQHKKLLKKKKVPTTYAQKLAQRIKDPVLQKVWDPNQSPGENRQKITLGLFTEEFSDEFAKRKKHIPEIEREALERMMKKHKGNVIAMARDLKLNRFQWTAGDILGGIKYLQEAAAEQQKQTEEAASNQA